MVVIVVAVVVRMTTTIRRLVRRLLVLVIRAWRVAVRVCMAGTAVPVLAHGVRIRRLGVAGQRVEPRLPGPAGMNFSHFAYNPRAHETLCRHPRL
jgi:hypothetical protein